MVNLYDLSEEYNKIIFELISRTKLSPVKENKHAAAVFKNNKIIYFGYNGRNSNEHAEISAIYNALNHFIKLDKNKISSRKHLTNLNMNKISFRKLNLIVIRYKSSGLKMSKPCKKCQEVIDNFDFKNIYYSDQDGKIQRLHRQKNN